MSCKEQKGFIFKLQTVTSILYKLPEEPPGKLRHWPGRSTPSPGPQRCSRAGRVGRRELVSGSAAFLRARAPLEGQRGRPDGQPAGGWVCLPSRPVWTWTWMLGGTWGDYLA